MIRLRAKFVKEGMMAYALENSVAVRRVSSRRPGPVLVLMEPAERRHAELLRRVARGGDVDAFRALFEHFAPRVKAYLIRLDGNAQIADDLAQETMLVLWRKAGLFDMEKASVSTWVFTVARNLRIDALRRTQRTVLEPNDPALMPAPIEAADVAIAACESEQAVRRAMKSLTPEQTQIVLMSFFSEKTHSEIAAELGIPLGTVKSRLRLAMERLRASLERPS